MSKNALIFDFETLGQNQRTAPVVSLAYREFSFDRFVEEPYTWDELQFSTFYLKFDVQEQITKYNRKAEKGTIKWWKEQPISAQKKLLPSKDDMSISLLSETIRRDVNTHNIGNVYTRGNTFDPMFMDYIIADTGTQQVYNWWQIRDTRSMIEGMAFGTDINNKFIPDDVKDIFVAHDPIHDVCMDIWRMQTLAQALS